MIRTIRLDEMLRATVAPTYRHLVTRPTGAAVRHGIQRALAAAPCLVLRLDFAAVELLDLSCADEVVAKLLLTLASAPLPFVALAGLREEHLEPLDHVLRHHRLAAPALPLSARRPHVLGWADADAREAFACVATHGPLSAPDLAGHLGWPGERAARSVASLQSLRLARVEGLICHPVPVT